MNNGGADAYGLRIGSAVFDFIFSSYGSPVCRGGAPLIRVRKKSALTVHFKQ